jgi:tetratricopeptide (TPR) repeat protein
MKRISTLIVCLLAAACGARQKAAMPGDESIKAEKTYLLSGDFDEAEKQFKKQLEVSPSTRTAFLLGDLQDVTGRPEEALESYFTALVIAHRSNDDPASATASAMAVTAIRDRIERFYDKLERFVQSIENTKGLLPDEAWFQLLNLRFGTARLRGKTEEAAAMLKELGCPTRFDVAGPVGPWIWYTFSSSRDELDKAVWPDAIDLGPGRGMSPIRDVKGDSCYIQLANPALPQGGVTWARTVALIKQAGPVFLRLQTDSAASLTINGQEVERRDPRNAYLPKTLWTKVTLPSGPAEIVVKVAGESASPSFSLAMFTDNGPPEFTTDSKTPLPTSVKIKPEAFDGIGRALQGEGGSSDSPGGLYAKMKCAVWWDDMERARELVLKITGQSKTPSSILLQNLAEITGADPSLPADLAYEQARPFLKQALELEPRLYQARIGLSDREVEEERVLSAIALLEEGRTLCPEEVSILQRLASTFFSYGWNAEADDAIVHLEHLMPTACSTLDWKLIAARSRSRFDLARTLAEQSVQCDVFSENLQEELRRASDFQGAVAESNRLFSLHPRSALSALEVVKSDIAAGLPDESANAFRKALDLAPTESALVVGLSDAHLTAGKIDEAESVIRHGITSSFTSKTTLLDAEAALQGKPLLESFRLDGLSVIKEYRAATPQYDAAAVYVLDRAVYLVDEMGGIVTLVHSIAELKTDEAVEDHGELKIPDGAKLLRARTIKADGRVLEPQEVSGKDTLSMPDLAPGDFVEYEYVSFSYPNQLFPGGFDTERFYFQDFNTGFHRTEIVVVIPEGMPIQTDPRGNCPPMSEERLGNLRKLTWKTRNASPHPSFPLAPSAVEYLPSIRITSSASWDTIFARIRDQIAGKDRIGHVINDVVDSALKGIDKNDHAARRRALYRWVTTHIETSRDMFEEAGHIIARKSGNRARAFAALLKAAGYSSRLALVMPGGEDETKNAVPSVKSFYRLVVDVSGEGFVDLGSEFVPFGFLPDELRNRPLRYVDTGELSTTGAGTPAYDSQAIAVSIKIKETGDAALRIKETIQGDQAGQWREAIEKVLPSDYERLFQGEYVANVLPGAELIRLNIEGLNDQEASLIFDYDVVIPKFARAEENNKFLVHLPFSTDFSKQSGGLPTRTVPLVLSVHARRTVETTIEIPATFQLIPDTSFAETVRETWGIAERSIVASDSKVVISLKNEMNVDRVPPEKYASFLSFVRKADQISMISLGMVDKK